LDLLLPFQSVPENTMYLNEEFSKEVTGLGLGGYGI
jgi:hypothetical protein